MLFINIKIIGKLTFKILSVLSIFIGLLFCFISFNDIFNLSIIQRIFCYISLIVLSLVISILRIVFKRKNIVWKKGNGQISIIYGDILKIGFSNKSDNDKIIVIPVNTHFDIEVEKLTSNKNNPLVSEKTIHGQWVIKILKYIEFNQLRKKISDSLKGIPYKYDDNRIKGNKKEYPYGTIAKVCGKNNVTFFLVALSKFNRKNVAKCEQDTFVNVLFKLIDFYNDSGQGYDIYVPLMGTNLSRINFSHEEALKVIKTVFEIKKDKIHGSVNIVIYDNDKDKVSIWS